MAQSHDSAPAVSKVEQLRFLLNKSSTITPNWLALVTYMESKHPDAEDVDVMLRHVRKCGGTEMQLLDRGKCLLKYKDEWVNQILSNM